MIQAIAFAPDVPLDIYGFHPYTKNSIALSHVQALQYQMQFLG